MDRKISRLARTVYAAALLAFGAHPALAQSVEEFYKDRTVTMVVASGPGGGYEFYARTVANHLHRHVPGVRNIIVQFVPGAGGAKAASQLYSVSPRDGSVMGLISNAAPLFQVLNEGVRYDAARFNFIGRAASMQNVVMVWHGSPVKRLEDMKTHEVIFGSTGKSQANYMVPIMLKSVLGLKARVVTGYPGTKNINLAMEKGEMSGRAGPWASWIAQEADWIRDKKVIPIAQAGLEKMPELPGVPLLLDFARNADEREVLALLASDSAVGRCFVMPPEVPKERVQAMRRAFDATMKDPAFLADARKRELIIEPMTGERLQEIVEKTVAASPAVIARAKAVLE